MKKAISLLLFIFALHSTPEPYKSITPLPFDSHGWYKNHHQMEKLFATYSPKIAIEVGSWLGQSTRHIATLLPPSGVLYAVDHWLGSEEHAGDSFKPLDTLYIQFLSNVIHSGLTEKIIPIRMSSLEAASVLNIKPDLIYIDAAHDYQSVYKDLTAWFPLVKGHGILCGDDWWMQGVFDAVHQFAHDHNLQIIGEDNFWYVLEKD